jgi:hypothetical protein
MKIVVLGGAGDMGSRAVEDLSTSPGVDEVTIADQNVPRARALADRLADAPARIHVTAVDANVKDSLVAVMRGHDVAASALGPFYRYETKLVSAALEADVDYASICDEPEPTQKVFDKFWSEAREQGRTVLVGLGTSPGTTNLAFAHLAAGMESVRRADIYCYQPLNGGGGRALLHHALHIINGKTLSWRRGRKSRIAALSEEATIAFPRFGTLRVWNMGHAEPLTIPRYHPEIRDVNFMMGFGLGSPLLVHPARWGAFATPSRIDAAVSVIAWIEHWLQRKPAHGAIRVEVEGTVGGQPVRKMLCGTGELRDVTGNALSIGAQMVARREITTTTGGVFAPEGCMRTDRALAEFARRGIQFFEDLEMTQPLLPPA